MELKIYIRHTQNHAIETDISTGIVLGDPIIFVGANPMELTPVTGTVPQPTYIDFTNDVSNLNKLKLTWTTERDKQGVSVPGGLYNKKASSNELYFEGEAYLFIKEWLVNSISAPLNSVDVKIEDVGCGTFDEFVIRSNDVTWCEDEVCNISANISQKDPAIHCVEQTVIYDNWQGWFQKRPEGGKKHPRFPYCDEVRPNGMMILMWYLLAFLMILMFILTPFIAIVTTIVNIIVAIINAFLWLFGGDPVPYVPYFNPIEASEKLYLESSGCGRMHPAPLVRDYIDNVCKKCGIDVNAVSDPIFHSKIININSSAEKTFVARDNPHYNATYFNAPAKKGIRIFRGLWDVEYNDKDYWIHENKPILTLDMFLDQLKTLYNAEWKIKYVGGVPTLYFWRKDWYKNGEFLYDFTTGTDRLKLLGGICFNWEDKRQYAYMRGLYSSDASDNCGNEAMPFMNDLVSLGNKTNNKNYDGELNKTTNYFGATKFRLDGVSSDYIADALQTLIHISPLSIPHIVAIFVIILPLIRKYADYVLLLSSDVAQLPKILLWDESTGYENARVIKTKRTGTSFLSGLPLPEKNIIYNTELKEWYHINEAETKVLGNVYDWDAIDDGVYNVQDIFGISYYKRPAIIMNYPMFFQTKFTDNIYDWFHWIDDPKQNPSLNLNFELRIEMCCDDLQKLKVFENDVALLDKVKIPNEYYNTGTITEITVSYDNEDRDGKYIEIKGII